MFFTASFLSLLFSATAETSTVEVLTPQGEWVDALIDENGTIHSENGIDLGSTALAWIPKGDGVGTIERRPFSMTKLTDGQVIIATFGGFHIEPPSTIVRWKHPGMGMMDISVDRTSLIQMQPMEKPPVASNSDEIVLRNGDRISGFIESFEEPIIIENAGVKREIPLDRVAGIALVSAQPKVAAVRVWLSDGSIIDGTSITGGFGGGFVLQGMSLGMSRSSQPILTDEIRCVSQSSKRMLPLSQLKPNVLPPISISLPRAEYPTPIVSTFEAPLGATAIEIRGPERLVYEIPKGFSVLSADVEIPPSVLAWADCAFVIRQNGQELGRYSLNAKNSKARIRVAVQPGPLEIEIEEAAGGPVGDTVILRRAILIDAAVGG